MTIISSNIKEIKKVNIVPRSMSMPILKTQRFALFKHSQYTFGQSDSEEIEQREQYSEIQRILKSASVHGYVKCWVILQKILFIWVS